MFRLFLRERDAGRGSDYGKSVRPRLNRIQELGAPPPLVLFDVLDLLEALEASDVFEVLSLVVLLDRSA